MKTVHVVVAAALVAVLPALMMRYVLPPRSVQAPVKTCEDHLGPGPRHAVATVRWNEASGRCMLKTVQSPLNACVGDLLLWEAAPIGDCGGYAGRMEIKQKKGGDDLTLEPSDPGTARGRVPQRPSGCPTTRKCRLEYSVTLHPTEGTDRPIVEDPHIDIW